MNNNIENLCIYFTRIEMDTVILMFYYCQFKFFIFCLIQLYILFNKLPIFLPIIFNKLPIYLLSFNFFYLQRHYAKDIKSSTNFSISITYM